VLYSDVTFGFDEQQFGRRSRYYRPHGQGRDQKTGLSMVHVTLVLIAFDKALKGRDDPKKTSGFYK